METTTSSSPRGLSNNSCAEATLSIASASDDDIESPIRVSVKRGQDRSAHASPRSTDVVSSIRRDRSRNGGTLAANCDRASCRFSAARTSSSSPYCANRARASCTTFISEPTWANRRNSLRTCSASLNSSRQNDVLCLTSTFQEHERCGTSASSPDISVRRWAVVMREGSQSWGRGTGPAGVVKPAASVTVAAGLRKHPTWSDAVSQRQSAI